MQETWQALVAADWDSLARLVLAVLLGGAIGLERESLRKPAGLRTHMLVALGSALATLSALELGMLVADLSRVVQGILTGIGFVGAGAILKRAEDQRVEGLTTAAGLWVTASVGIAVAAGHAFLAGASVGLVILILYLLGRLEGAVPVREGGDTPSRDGREDVDAQR